MENKSISLKLIKNKADKSLTLQLNFVIISNKYGHNGSREVSLKGNG